MQVYPKKRQPPNPNRTLDTKSSPVPLFAVGDRVCRIALPDGIPTPVTAVHGLVVTSRRLIGPSMPNTPAALAPYWRYAADRLPDALPDEYPRVHSCEGAERFFEPEGGAA